MLVFRLTEQIREISTLSLRKDLVSSDIIDELSRCLHYIACGLGLSPNVTTHQVNYCKKGSLCLCHL